jgi:hypothetical protein
LLGAFLERNRFQEVWTRAQKNYRTSDALIRAFHVWFDAFRTLKLIHDLTDNAFPRCDMFVALSEMFDLMGVSCPVAINGQTRSSLRDQIKIINVFNIMQ